MKFSYLFFSALLVLQTFMGYYPLGVKAEKTFPKPVSRIIHPFEGDSHPGVDGSGNGTEAGCTSAAESPLGVRTASSVEFVASSGGNLDCYLFRNQLPNGKLTFNVPIDRAFSTLPIAQAIGMKVLPPKATLFMSVYDVDDASELADGSCAEKDEIYINGHIRKGEIKLTERLLNLILTYDAHQNNSLDSWRSALAALVTVAGAEWLRQNPYVGL